MTDPIAAARAMIEPLTGYTPGPWEAVIYDDYGFIYIPLSGYDGDFKPSDARLIVAAPDLRDMVATLADALETERAKVAAAFKAGIKRGVAHAAGHTCEDEGCPHYGTRHTHPGDLEAPADAQAALDKLLAEARLEGWRAGREAAANEAALYGCSEGADEYTKGIHEGYTDAVVQIVDGIRSMPEPKEASHD